MKTILFYWSKGSETRRSIIRIIYENQKSGCYLNLIAEKIGISHVAIKKHLDLLLEEGYVKIINPSGKPIFLELTERGLEIFNETNTSDK